ncbi:MAG: FAD-binding protein [Rhodococcus sp. (in: high G+C Gram-positive bacteria)]
MVGVQWDGDADVVIVGFGAAGACAAIEASDAGASVLVLDRFGGGGATEISGGVVYSGGGTSIQREAGVEDSPEAMLDYLRREVGDAVSPSTLESFCTGSVEQLEWLRAQGVPFDASFDSRKTSYPTNDVFLYYSGNETVPAYRSEHAPAARGHRSKGRGVSGKSLFGGLRGAVARRPIEVIGSTTVSGLIRDDTGAVIGVECLAVQATSLPWPALHRTLARRTRKWNLYYRPFGRKLESMVVRIERSRSVTKRYRARTGVVIAAGGFAFDRAAVAEHAPAFRKGSPLGTMSDDGSGIELGRSVGGAVSRMDKMSAWRFFNPPLAMVGGVLVDSTGRRLCNESLYGATIGSIIAAQPDSKAYLIIDENIRRRAASQIFGQCLWFQMLQAVFMLTIGARSASTLHSLAQACGMDPETLESSVRTYSDDARAGRPDAFGKIADYVRAFEPGRVHAIDCSIRSQLAYPCPVITLGGLSVSERNGAVLGSDNEVIAGLFAVGRSAVGICSESYVSGLSIADCIFSGRRTGAALGVSSASRRLFDPTGERA